MTGYGLEGPGSEFRWDEIFLTWGPPSLLYNGYWVSPGGKNRPGRDADPSPPSSDVVKKVEPYLHCPYGPYSLYRASVPVPRVHLILPPILATLHNWMLSPPPAS